MSLNIETFSNVTGGNAFFKAVSHPLAATKARALIGRLEGAGKVATYDPLGMLEGFAAIHDLSAVDIAQLFVQDTLRIGETLLGCTAQPVTDLAASDADLILLAGFDSARLESQIAPLVPEGCTLISLDGMRLDETLLSNRDNYLDPLNFCTNFAFFRDSGNFHTTVATAEYWTRYGADRPSLHLVLFGANGAVLAEWDEQPAAGGAIAINSAEVRKRFALDEFTGQLFIHATGVAGHDIVKYAIDTFSDDGTMLSCSHDANAWPSDLYGGLPAPHDGEAVLLWVQNSYPCPIPAGTVGLNLMGSDNVVRLDEDIAPFATHAVTVGELLPDAAWPEQVEIQAGRHFVRPRYEVIASDDKRLIAHVNVERSDLKPDPDIPDLNNLMGKGYILPAPVLPLDRWRSVALPTPMSTAQDTLPLAALVIDASGREVARRSLGQLLRNHRTALDVADLLDGSGGLPSGYGHVELVYDFSDGGAADGWLHGLFRYEDRASGHAAETSFGAHIYNTVLTYRDEPQSYNNRAPGLTTRLFLRLGPAPYDTMCHLIYPASTPWHGTSDTTLTLYDGNGAEVAERHIEIPCSGSLLWRYSESFDKDDRESAGDGAYVMITDATCRLFGYHGLLNGNGAFSLDHMFGF